MRLKKKTIKKQALALAIAATVAVSVPVTANAQVDWDAGKGTVTVEEKDGKTISSQKDANGNAQSGKEDGKEVYSSEDKDIHIKGDGKDDTTESKDTIVEVKGDVSDAKITIDGVDNKTEGGDSAIKVDGKADITVKDTDITLDDNSKGVDVEDNSDVDITTEGKNTITGGDTGIDIGEKAKVDIIGKDGGELVIKGSDTGIRVGRDSMLDIKGGAKVSIKDDDDDKGEKKDKQTVGIENNGEVKIEGSGTTVSIVDRVFGILSKGEEQESANGDVTVTDDAELTVDSADAAVMLTGEADLTISDGADVAITDTAEDGASIVMDGQGVTASVDNASLSYDGEVDDHRIQATSDVDSTTYEDGKAYISGVQYDSIKTAIENASDGATIQLGGGKYTTYGNTSPEKSLTFVGLGAGVTEWGIGATIPDPTKFGTEYNGDYSFDGCETITFKNMTLQSGTVDYLGFIRINNIIVEDCTINNRTHYWGYQTTLFKNVTFNAPENDYALWATTGREFTFDTCTFNISGKAVNVYYDYTDDPKEVTINYKDCIVNSTKANKSVLNIKDTDSVGNSHNDSTKGITAYKVYFSGKNIVNGLNPDGTTCSRLFQVQYTSKDGTASTKCATTVYIDNTKVWENGKMVDHEIKKSDNEIYTDGYIDHTAYVNGETETDSYTITNKRDDYTDWAVAEDWNVSDGATYYTKKYARMHTHIENEKCNYCGWEATDVKTETSEEKYEYGYKVKYVDGYSDAVLQATDDVVAVEKQGDTYTVTGTDPTYTGSTPTREGYTFNGWTKSEPVNGVVTYTAQWTENAAPAPEPGEPDIIIPDEKPARDEDDGIRAEDIWYWVTPVENGEATPWSAYNEGDTLVVVSNVDNAILHVELDGWDEHDEVKHIRFETNGKTTTLEASKVLSQGGNVGELQLTHRKDAATLAINGTDRTDILQPVSGVPSVTERIKSFFGVYAKH